MIATIVAAMAVSGRGIPSCDEIKGGIAQAQCHLTEDQALLGNRDCSHPIERQDREVCSLLAFRHADVQLNVVWAELLSAIATRDQVRQVPSNVTKGVISMLKAAEVGWVEYRVQHCRSLAAYARTGDNELLHQCLARVTLNRISELNQYFGAVQDK